MKAPDTKGEFQPLGPSKRQIEETRAKDKPADVVKNVKPGVRTRNGLFETHIPGNEAAKAAWVYVTTCTNADYFIDGAELRAVDPGNAELGAVNLVEGMFGDAL